MMVLIGTNAPSCTLHSPCQAVVQQNAYAVNQRLCQNRVQIGGVVYARRVLPLTQQGRSSNSWQAQTTWLKGLGRQHRWKLTRCRARENEDTDEYHETDDYRNEIEEDPKAQEREVVDVVASRPSVEALTEIDSTVTVRRSSSTSSPVRNQPQKSVRGREGGGGLQWILGPLALLITGALPALWLPSPALFGGSATAGLLALTGLDAVFNMGATAFLLMADYSAGGQSQDPSMSKVSVIPLGYKVWSFLVNLVGLVAPVALVVASWRGMLQGEGPLPLLPAAALLGPYTLLVVVQWLAEALVWQWQSPVWPVLPLVYQAYRLLQLTRGIELGVALDAPSWLVKAVKGLLAWWVFVLGMQIMWVAWLVGTIQTRYSRSG
ncbi:unnamed protein product [Calypogeia fissa]